MANITWLIGNGFDIQIGMRTRYANFYESYVKDVEGDNDRITKFKRSILGSEADRWVNWADFEAEIGKASSKFDSLNDFGVKDTSKYSIWASFRQIFHSESPARNAHASGQYVHSALPSITKNLLVNPPKASI